MHFFVSRLYLTFPAMLALFEFYYDIAWEK